MSDNNWQNRLEQLGGRFSGHTFLGLDAVNKTSSGDTMTILSHESITSVSGPDTVRFLQGQLTCNINSLSTDQLTLGASCTPKGRMVANFRALNHDNRLLLTMPAATTDSQHDALKTHLGKYIVFYKAEIHDVSNEWLRIGIFGDSCESTLSHLATLPEPNHCHDGDGYLLLRLPGVMPRYELWLHPTAIDTWWQRLIERFTIKPTLAWQQEDIKEGIAWVTAPIREHYIPQHLNWQILEGVSFKKGCYTGQEIVARMQYLGKLKSRLYRLTGILPELPTPGTRLCLSSTGKNVGEIISAIQTDNGESTELLAVLRSDAVNETLYIEAHPSQHLSVTTLPYEV